MVTTSTSGGGGAAACFLGPQAVNATRGSKERSRTVYFISRIRRVDRGIKNCALWNSTDGDQRNPLIAIVASDTARIRVKRWFAIHKKQIAVMAVMQFQTGHPPTIGRTANGIRCGIPSIEITCQVHALDPGRIAEKSHVMLLTSGGVRPLRLGGIAFASRRVHFFDCVFKFIIP